MAGIGVWLSPCSHPHLNIDPTPTPPLTPSPPPSLSPLLEHPSPTWTDPYYHHFLESPMPRECPTSILPQLYLSATVEQPKSFMNNSWERVSGCIAHWEWPLIHSILCIKRLSASIYWLLLHCNELFMTDKGCSSTVALKICSCFQGTSWRVKASSNHIKSKSLCGEYWIGCVCIHVHVNVS